MLLYKQNGIVIMNKYSITMILNSFEETMFRVGAKEYRFHWNGRYTIGSACNMVESLSARPVQIV